MAVDKVAEESENVMELTVVVRGQGAGKVGVLQILDVNIETGVRRCVQTLSTTVPATNSSNCNGWRQEP